MRRPRGDRAVPRAQREQRPSATRATPEQRLSGGRAAPTSDQRRSAEAEIRGLDLVPCFRCRARIDPGLLPGCGLVLADQPNATTSNDNVDKPSVAILRAECAYRCGGLSRFGPHCIPAPKQNQNLNQNYWTDVGLTRTLYWSTVGLTWTYHESHTCRPPLRPVRDYSSAARARLTPVVMGLLSAQRGEGGGVVVAPSLPRPARAP